MNRDKHIEKLLGNYSVPSTVTKEEAWKDLSTRLQPENEKTFKIGKLLQVAAVFVLAFIITVLADSLVFVQKYSSDFTEKKIITLRDNSKVTLSSNSKLKVNYSFITGKRKLNLEGYALFDVITGKTFSVNFPGGKVTVLGTRFTIAAYNNIKPEINCLSGTVKVKTKNDQSVLVQGQGLVLNNKSGIKKVKIVEETVLAEINGNYSWENERLINIFRVMEAQLGYRIDASQEVKNRKFTGAVNLNNIKHSLDVLSFAMDLNYSIDEQKNKITFEDNK